MHIARNRLEHSYAYHSSLTSRLLCLFFTVRYIQLQWAFFWPLIIHTAPGTLDHLQKRRCTAYGLHARLVQLYNIKAVSNLPAALVPPLSPIQLKRREQQLLQKLGAHLRAVLHSRPAASNTE